MPDEIIFDALDEREQEVLEIQLAAAVGRTSITLQEYVDIRLLQGASRALVRQELLADLSTGGRIFGEFRNSIRATAHGNSRRVADIGSAAEQGIDKDFRWITVRDKNVCIDCEPRHSVIRTWVDWEAIGLPRTGWSLCRMQCRCVLADVKADIPPVKRERPR